MTTTVGGSADWLTELAAATAPFAAGFLLGVVTLALGLVLVRQTLLTGQAAAPTTSSRKTDANTPAASLKATVARLVAGLGPWIHALLLRLLRRFLFVTVTGTGAALPRPAAGGAATQRPLISAMRPAAADCLCGTAQMRLPCDSDDAIEAERQRRQQGRQSSFSQEADSGLLANATPAAGDVACAAPEALPVLAALAATVTSTEEEMSMREDMLGATRAAQEEGAPTPIDGEGSSPAAADADEVDALQEQAQDAFSSSSRATSTAAAAAVPAVVEGPLSTKSDPDRSPSASPSPSRPTAVKLLLVGRSLVVYRTPLQEQPPSTADQPVVADVPGACVGPDDVLVGKVLLHRQGVRVERTGPTTIAVHSPAPTAEHAAHAATVSHRRGHAATTSAPHPGLFQPLMQPSNVPPTVPLPPSSAAPTAFDASTAAESTTVDLVFETQHETARWLSALRAAAAVPRPHAWWTATVQAPSATPSAFADGVATRMLDLGRAPDGRHPLVTAAVNASLTFSASRLPGGLLRARAHKEGDEASEVGLVLHELRAGHTGPTLAQDSHLPSLLPAACLDSDDDEVRGGGEGPGATAPPPLRVHSVGTMRRGYGTEAVLDCAVSSAQTRRPIIEAIVRLAAAPTGTTAASDVFCYVSVTALDAPVRLSMAPAAADGSDDVWVAFRTAPSADVRATLLCPTAFRPFYSETLGHNAADIRAVAAVMDGLRPDRAALEASIAEAVREGLFGGMTLPHAVPVPMPRCALPHAANAAAAWAAAADTTLAALCDAQLELHAAAAQAAAVTSASNGILSGPAAPLGSYPTTPLAGTGLDGHSPLTARSRTPVNWMGAAPPLSLSRSLNRSLTARSASISGALPPIVPALDVQSLGDTQSRGAATGRWAFTNGFSVRSVDNMAPLADLLGAVTLGGATDRRSPLRRLLYQAAAGGEDDRMAVESARRRSLGGGGQAFHNTFSHSAVSDASPAAADPATPPHEAEQHAADIAAMRRRMEEMQLTLAATRAATTAEQSALAHADAARDRQRADEAAQTQERLRDLEQRLAAEREKGAQQQLRMELERQADEERSRRRAADAMLEAERRARAEHEAAMGSRLASTERALKALEDTLRQSATRPTGRNGNGSDMSDADSEQSGVSRRSYRQRQRDLETLIQQKHDEENNRRHAEAQRHIAELSAKMAEHAAASQAREHEQQQRLQEQVTALRLAVSRDDENARRFQEKENELRATREQMERDRAAVAEEREALKAALQAAQQGLEATASSRDATQQQQQDRHKAKEERRKARQHEEREARMLQAEKELRALQQQQLEQQQQAAQVQQEKKSTANGHGSRMPSPNHGSRIPTPLAKQAARRAAAAAASAANLSGASPGPHPPAASEGATPKPANAPSTTAAAADAPNGGPHPPVGRLSLPTARRTSDEGASDFDYEPVRHTSRSRPRDGTPPRAPSPAAPDHAAIDARIRAATGATVSDQMEVCAVHESGKGFVLADTLLDVDEVSISDFDHFRALMQGPAAGTTVHVSVLRGTAIELIAVTLP